MQFYTANAPELEITNLLDDGLLRLLAAKDSATAASRLRNMIQSAVETYGAELAMITCSSVSKEMADGLAAEFALPILKIDYPMAQQAVAGGGKIGVAATFPPTLEPTTRLISEAAMDAGTTVEIVREVSPDAYRALLANDTATHDELLLALIEELEAQGVSVIVLAQVSMARVLPLLNGRITVPVLSSLQTSLEAIRQVLNNTSSNRTAAPSQI
jgi:Asp/Glu/hydantoin racemase